MIVQLVLNFLILLCYFVSTNIEKNKRKSRRLFVFSACIILIVHAGLRSLETGADTEHYFSIFTRIQGSSWAEIFGSVVEDRSLLFYPMTKLFQLFSNNFQLYLFLIATIFYTSFFRMLYLNVSRTRDIFMAILIFQILFLYLPFSSFKQAVAMSIVFVAFEMYKGKRYLMTALFVIFAATFHPSAILFTLVFFIAPFKKPRLLMLLTLMGSILLFTYGRDFVEIMSLAAGGDNDYYMMQYVDNKTRFAGAYSFMALMLIVTIADGFMYKKILALNPQNIYYINFASLALLLTPLAWVNPTLIRLLGYFSIYMVVLIPLIVNTVKPKELSNVVYFTSCLFFLVYTIFIKYEDYSFFWETPSY